jgi:hypothetical protein
MFASSSRLDLRFVLPKKGGHMKTIMSHHFPPLPIDIHYNCTHRSIQPKDMSRILSALKRPDRIRRIALIGTKAILGKLLKATNCPLPALESVQIRDKYNETLKIPATFLKGSHLNLRTLKLDRISLPSTSRLLSSVPALTYLHLLLIHSNVGPPPAMLLLSHLQGMPCLRRLDLEITSSMGQMSQPTNTNENFTLSKLTSFRYRGHSAFLNTLIAGFTAPSLREIDIQLPDRALFPIHHLSRFIDDIEVRCHAVQVVLKRNYSRISLFGPSEYVGDHSPYFRLCLHLFPESVMQMNSAFLSKLITTDDLSVIVFDNADAEQEVIPWRRFFLQFPSVKALRLYRTNYRRVASALHQDSGDNLACFPALEEIELCMGSSSTPKGHASKLAAFEPFVSARQQAGFPVKVVANMRALTGSP